MIERRNTERVPVDGQAWIRHDGRWIECRLLDLSEDGIGLVLPVDLWAGLQSEAQIKGKVSVQDQKCMFAASICWAVSGSDEVKIGASIDEFSKNNFPSLIRAHLLVADHDPPEFTI
ncbi:MAG: PilZ domain-containing protein [Acidobacteria bacterium]|nr:PilZ domain-containing protein [Acidobacteriota bacterium]